jgi:hypothetical protein
VQSNWRLRAAWLASLVVSSIGTMRKAKLIVFVLTALVVASIAVLVTSSPRPGSIPYHLQRLGALRQEQPFIGPSSFRDYFRSRTWLWYLQGRPSISDSIAEMEEHQQALIHLGYFERRKLTFSHRTLDAHVWSEFRSAISNSALADWRYMLHLDDSRPSVIRVTACKSDVPVFERIVSQIDTNATR